VLVYVGWTFALTSALWDVESLRGLTLLACGGALAWFVVAVAGAVCGSPRAARDLLALLALPAWGMRWLYELSPGCDVTIWMNVHSCHQEPDLLRPLAVPQVYDLVALHLAACTAYVAAVRNPKGLRDHRLEPVVRALMLVAACVHVAISAQVLNPVTRPPVVPAGNILPYVVTLGGLLASCPSAALFVAALWARPGRAPVQRAAAQMSAEATGPAYRDVPRRGAGPPVAPRMWPTTVVFALAVITLYGAGSAVLHGRARAPLEPFSLSCGYLFSRRAVAVHCPNVFGFNCCQGQPVSVAPAPPPQ
jgi:hypothetical protein